MPEQFIKKYRPGAFVPSTSYTGSEESLVLYGENMWIRFGRFGSVYAEGYTGNRDLNENIPMLQLTATSVSWIIGSKQITVNGGALKPQLREGQFVFLDGGPNNTHLVVAESIESNTSFTADLAPDQSGNGTAKIMPVLFPVGPKRGTAIAGNVVQFFKGHYLGVGQGELRINGAPLNAPFNLLKKPQIALFDNQTETYSINDVGINLPVASPLITLTAVTPATPTQMRAGRYGVRVCAKNTKTNGFSNPSAVIDPVTLTAGQAIQVTFNAAMVSDQDAYDIYCSEFKDNSATTIEVAYMGPWYKVKTVEEQALIDGTHPTGRESGTIHVFFFSDGELQVRDILTFDNFPAPDSEFVDLINGIPIWFSCQGRGYPGKKSASPGPAAVPSKPSNPEAALLNKTFTTAGGDLILGEFNVKSRIFALCQTTLQQIILTTLDSEPIAFRSMWNVGFRNPYNVAFAKEYLYGMSTQGIVRSVAGGDETSMEFDFADDVQTYISGIPAARGLLGYDPKNKAMCLFLSAKERRSGFWITAVLPFHIGRNVWNPPILLSKPDQDFIVSGVATIGNELIFLAGGRNSAGVSSVGTYVFDGGDNFTKNWFLAWNYSDDGREHNTKRIVGFSSTGRFASINTALKIYGVAPDRNFDLKNLEGGVNADASRLFGISGGAAKSIKKFRYQVADFPPFSLYSVRMDGNYITIPDRLDELSLKIEVNSSEM